MSSNTTVVIKTTDADQTEAVAEKLGRKLQGGEVIELISDLGGGKTTFVRGLARGMGSDTHVSSPTFKISNVYTSPKLELHHFDFYRLLEAGVVANELAEVLDDPNVVVAVEWGGIVQDVLPAKRLTINFQATGENARELIVTSPPSLQYMIEGIV